MADREGRVQERERACDALAAELAARERAVARGGGAEGAAALAGAVGEEQAAWLRVRDRSDYGVVIFCNATRQRTSCCHSNHSPPLISDNPHLHVPLATVGAVGGWDERSGGAG